MSYPTWRVESWYEGNRWIGFRVVKGVFPALTVADNGYFRIDRPDDPFCKPAMRAAAMNLRDNLTMNEADPLVLAKECRAILREILSLAVVDANHPTALVVPSLQTHTWLKDRIDRLCNILNVKDDM